MAARYWRITAMRTASNALALSALALSDGTNDYPTDALTGALSAGFSIVWDLGADVDVSQIKLTAITQPDFPLDFLLESSTGGVMWEPATVFSGIVYPGNGLSTNLSNGDEYFDRVTLLLHGDGVNGSTVFGDASTHNHVAVTYGSPTIVADPDAFGGAAIRVQGGQSVMFADTDIANMAADDFCIEFRVKPDSAGAAAYLNNYGSGASSSGFVIQSNGGGILAAYMYVGSGSVECISAASTIVANVYNTIKYSRQGPYISLFVGGVLKASATSILGMNTSTAKFRIGAESDTGAYPANANFDEIRVTKGAGIPSAAPAIGPFPNSGSLGVTTPAVFAVAAGGVIDIADESMPEPSLFLVPSQITTLDTLDGGIYQVAGTVAKKSLPTNTPLARRVMLIGERSHRVVREMWSDAAGNYTFSGLAGDTTYTTLSYDHTGTNRAVIADGIVPEVMP